MTELDDLNDEVSDMFHCEDCIHYKDGKCDLGFELCEYYEDAYDCTSFEDANPV